LRPLLQAFHQRLLLLLLLLLLPLLMGPTTLRLLHQQSWPAQHPDLSCMTPSAAAGRLSYLLV
jgi:hypothetical protein